MMLLESGIIKKEFIQSGAVRSTLDNAMFMWYDENDVLIGHLVSHVDDFNYTGTDKWQRGDMDAIKGKSNISAESEIQKVISYTLV